MVRRLIASVAVLAIWLVSTVDTKAAIVWRAIEPGLALARVAAPIKSTDGDSIITMVRIDPKRFQLRLATARAHGEKTQTTADWAKQLGFVAAINAGMYLKDYSTSVGYMRDGRRVINPRLNAFRAVLAFNRRSRRAPPVFIIDRTCAPFKKYRRRYATFIQSIRMIGCRGRNLWKPSTKAWSIAAIATDSRGRVLLIHCASPYSVHRFIAMLQGLKIGIKRAMYLDGGSPASLFVGAGGVKLNLYGTHGSSGPTTFPAPRSIPNVIGIVRRK